MANRAERGRLCPGSSNLLRVLKNKGVRKGRRAEGGVPAQTSSKLSRRGLGCRREEAIKGNNGGGNTILEQGVETMGRPGEKDPGLGRRNFGLGSSSMGQGESRTKLSVRDKTGQVWRRGASLSIQIFFTPVYSLTKRGRRNTSRRAADEIEKKGNGNPSRPSQIPLWGNEKGGEELD